MEDFPLHITRQIHIQRIDHLLYLCKGGLSLTPMKEQRGYGLIYVKKGKLQVIGESETYVLEKYDFLLLKPEEKVEIIPLSKTQVELLIIVFYCQHTSLEKLKNKLLKLTQKEQEILQSLIIETQILQKNRNFLKEEAEALSISIPFANEQMIFLSLEYLLIHLIRRLELPLHLAQAKDNRQNNTYPKDLESILDYLSLHLYEYLTLEQISQDNGISQTKVQHLFKKYLNSGVIQHFMGMKIEMAKSLMATGEMNFTQISDQLGYSSIHYFSRQFKKVTGMTPTAYLEQTKKDGDPMV